MQRWYFPIAVLVTLSLDTSGAQSPAAAPVTTERLRQSPPGEWLTYGLDHAETRFSPLTRITPENVKNLKSAWAWDIPGGSGQIEATPLVHDGVLYASGTWSVIFALDARTGALKWKWDPGIIRGGRTAGGQTVINGAPNRGVALYNGKVYAGLQDGRLVALDAATGAVVWVRMTIPYGNSEYVVTGAPRIVKGKVIIGNGGAEFHNVRGYVTAYDAETGDQAWRFYIVPGDPAQPFESNRRWRWRPRPGPASGGSTAAAARLGQLLLRSRGQPRLHRHGQRRAVESSLAQQGRGRQPLPQLDRRRERRHGGVRLALPDRAG